jgi:hypothetical protein
MTNKTLSITMFFIAVNALHVSGGFSAHHQELKIQNCTHSIWYVLSLLPATSSGGELELTLREERRLRVFENRVLKIFGPKRDEVTRVWIKVHN